MTTRRKKPTVIDKLVFKSVLIWFGWRYRIKGNFQNWLWLMTEQNRIEDAKWLFWSRTSLDQYFASKTK